ncbi:hypothetical protein [Pontivivens insulae]|uniref:Lipoprotein n=1 Tax=Pontivivens insulae TaxID=1639689 RepID=A0A2R8ADX3_9RHOB|nr:hypothetical protein [Pontivivens insulae]RED14285.1 hypothetical protein DFR53_1642 [Pontivivens insulae]SPF30362.1 hypothetical protein POI8812_02698 [Pontivivens insulae]
MRLLFILGACGALAACGSSTGDRGLSGGAIGLGAGAVLGVAAAPAIVVGAATGALTGPSDVNLGDPVWD